MSRHLPNPDFPKQHTVPGSRILTLAELLDLITNMQNKNAEKVGMHIELKTFPRHSVPPSREFANLVVPQIKRAGLLDRTIFQSFDPRYTAEANKLARQLGRSGVPSVISPRFNWITKWFVKILHMFGFKVIPWTANTEKVWNKLIRMRVDGIITDNPEELIRYLRKKPQMQLDEDL
ncbi:MAG: glycerophosphodiester phosphodiesterase family protein [Bdellovibrionota bacterium]